jgi:DNA-binding MarR family transcriptional regulator
MKTSEKSAKLVSNFELFLLMGKINHLTFLARQRELNHYHIPGQQLHVLRIIQELGPKATLSEVAKNVERKINVISRQTISMEKDGLIKRIKDTPKSRLLRIELTDKGLEMLKIGKESKTIDAILSALTEKEKQQVYTNLSKVLAKLKKGIKI